MIAQTNAGNVDTVIVDGRIVKRHGVLTHVDVGAALATIDASHDRLEKAMADNGGFIPQPPAELPVFDR